MKLSGRCFRIEARPIGYDPISMLFMHFCFMYVHAIQNSYDPSKNREKRGIIMLVCKRVTLYFDSLHIMEGVLRDLEHFARAPISRLDYRFLVTCRYSHMPSYNILLSSLKSNKIPNHMSRLFRRNARSSAWASAAANSSASMIRMTGAARTCTTPRVRRGSSSTRVFCASSAWSRC